MEFAPLTNRKYKDSLFRLVFGSPEHKDLTLSLYNAISGSDIKDPEEIEFTTLENVIFMDSKNDLSFIVADELVVAEHQSTMCGNMPIRMLVYAAMIYKRILAGLGMKPYGSKTIRLSVPKLVCFYNGTADMEERCVRRLSEAFPEGSEPDIEANVLMLNINSGRNGKLLDSCAPLAGYSQFTDNVRRLRLETGMTTTEAVERAIDMHPTDSPIKRILEDNRAEVSEMFMYEFDEEEYREVIREEAHEEGLAKGLAEGRAEGRAEGLAEGLAEGRAEGERRIALLMTKLKELGLVEDAFKAASDSEFRNKLYKEYNL